MRRAARVFAVIVLALILSGSLGAPARRGEVPFDVVRREFDALAVVKVPRSVTDDAPLVVRVRMVGDARDADIGQAAAWLRANANVALVRDDRGVPLFLTNHDLSATSGRATLGATLSSGMSAEVANARVGPCVVAHEVLHFLGLKHVEERANIMAAQCSRDKLDSATFSSSQWAQLQGLDRIVATTPRGVVNWAERVDASPPALD